MSELPELVPSLRRALNPPGEDLFPGATDEEWVGRLADAFWRARLAGFFPGHREQLGDIEPDLSREELEIVVAYARVAALQARITNLATSQRYKAGPVESEQQRPAQVLVAMLKEASSELAEVAARVPQTPMRAAFLDGVSVRTAAVLAGAGWVR